MFAALGAFLFLIISTFTFLVACGLPFGEFTMGGQHKILSNIFRIMAMVSFVIQLFAIMIILQAGGFIELWFSHNTIKYICFSFAVYLSLNTIMNLFSKSKKEKYIMTPLSLLTAICFWMTAFTM